MKTLIPVNPSHKNNFDFFRLVFALTVIYTHGYVLFLGLPGNPEPFWQHSKQQLALGTLGLDFFFIISGFLVLQSFERSRSWKDYLKKRVLRIYPGFIVVSIVCALLFAPLGMGTPAHPFSGYNAYLQQVNWGKFFSAALLLLPVELPDSFLHNIVPNFINGSIWTIWYEFVFYLVILFFGFIGVYKRKWTLLIIFGLLFFLCCLHWHIYRTYGNAVEKDLPWIFKIMKWAHAERVINLEHFSSFFFAGACFYKYRQHVPKSKLLLALSFLLLLVSLRWVMIFELVLVLCGSYILFWFVFSNKLRLYNAAKYGDFSYGIYLYGWPVQQLLVLYAGTKINLAAMLLLSVLCVLPFAFFSWHVIEKPALKLKPRKRPAGDEALATAPVS